MSLPTFVTDDPFTAPGTVTLGEDAAHHMRVRRLETGVRVGLVDGVGTRGEGVLTQLAKRHAIVSVEHAERVPAPPPVHLLVPVADRDRMLWLAEKVTELGLSTWRPVLYRRSKHVNPRGEGTTFQQRVRARMGSALEQSRGAWLPVTFPEAALEQVIAGRPPGIALVLDQGARPLLDSLRSVLAAPPHGPTPVAAITLAVGPEGGFEVAELAALEANGFARASVGVNILRFETAALAGLAAVRAALDLADSGGAALGDDLRGVD